jgi:hypothetical protein
MNLRAFILALMFSFVLSSSPHPTVANEPVHHPDQANHADIVIYGGTSAGIIAGVQAKKEGLSVIILSPDQHLGGLTAGGLGWTDTGNKEVIGGLSRNFYQRVKQKYDNKANWKTQAPESYKLYRADSDSMWVFEPHIAEEIYEEIAQEYKLHIIRDAWLDLKNGVKKEGNKIVSITTTKGTFTGKIFIDATYEGDLMAKAGVSYTVGRESNSQYNETLNGVQAKNARSHQFKGNVDPYIIPGDKSSGLVPRIHGGSPGEDGAGDKRIQAYCFRMCLTNDPENRVEFPKPAHYDAKQYELLARYLALGFDEVFGKFDIIPNNKTDTNNHGGFSFDNIGMNYDYPEADYETRAKIIQEHKDYQMGLLWFLANDPRVPPEIQNRMKTWGLPKDEFKDNGNWSHQIYVREARRMVSDFVTTERHLRKVDLTPESIGMGSYNMDSHNTQRYVDADGFARNEGDIQVNPRGPYPISYKSIVPKESECANLIVPVCVSSSHIAYGSIRMEPVFMILGESAVTAAAIAIKENISVQNVSYEKLRAKLLEQKQVMEFDWQASANDRGNGIDPKSLTGIVLDNEICAVTGEWAPSHSMSGFVGSDYLHDSNTNKGKSTATFEKAMEKSGTYTLMMNYIPNPNRATNIPVKIKTGTSEQTVMVNQREILKDQVEGKKLATLMLTKGEKVTVTICNEGTNGYVIVDAIRFVPVK